MCSNVFYTGEELLSDNMSRTFHMAEVVNIKVLWYAVSLLASLQEK